MQATRGAALSAAHPDSRPSRGRSRIIFGLLALAAYAVDQVTKVLAARELSSGESVSVVGDLLQLTLVRNPGAAFGAGGDFTIFFSVVAVIALGVVLTMSLRVATTSWAIAFGFLGAGVAGNLTDRLLREPGILHGHVIDFLQLPNWPVFNVADICINVGGVLMVILLLRGVDFDGSRETHGQR